MVDKCTDQHRNLDRQDQIPDKSHRFINEKIIQQPMAGRQIARKILLTIFCIVLFDVLSTICFVMNRSVAERILGQEAPEESNQITIPKDEPEATTPVTMEAEPTEPVVTEAVDEMAHFEMGKHRYLIDNLNKLYSNLRTTANDAGDSLVMIRSIRHEKDWFNNPIETSKQFSGVVVTKTHTEILVLTPGRIVETADSTEVVFPDGTMITGIAKQSDIIMELSAVGVDTAQMDGEQFKRAETIGLGNSCGVKQGDMVVAIGVLADIARSSDYGDVSYVTCNVHMVGGSSRALYTSASGDAEAETFLLNASGEFIGWVTDKYDEDGVCRTTTVVAISDYKDILEMVSSGIPAPYFGIKGQEVSQAMTDSGMSSGIYAMVAVTDSPAYSTGIQPGDIIIWVSGERVGSLKDFQNQMENLHAGDKIKTVVLRNGKDEYKEIELLVTVGAKQRLGLQKELEPGKNNSRGVWYPATAVDEQQSALGSVRNQTEGLSSVNRLTALLSGGGMHWTDDRQRYGRRYGLPGVQIG